MDKNIVKFELAWNPIIMGDFPANKLNLVDEGVSVTVEQLSTTLNQIITICIDERVHPNILEITFSIGMLTAQLIK